MKLGGDYTSGSDSFWRISAVSLAAALLLYACAGPQATAGSIEVVIRLDDTIREADVPAGSTVQQALEVAGIAIDELDRVDPPSYTVLTDGSQIAVTSVDELFETEQVVVAYERQTIRSESLPEGETRLIQPGVNGLEEITYRVLMQGATSISRSAVQRKVINEPQAEIVMVGAESTFESVEIDGLLAYVSGGNGWIMRASSDSRIPLITTGDMDGRVLSLSADGEWLAYTRSSGEGSRSINSLWVTRVTDPDFEPLDLDVQNVVHFADWAPTPGVRTLAYSTVEPRPAAPGWQANNDLHLIRLSALGTVLSRESILETNTGGQYGWWGMDFAWAGDGRHLAFARADGVGIIDTREPGIEELIKITPLETLGEWAWVPGLSWSSLGDVLYFGQHAPPIGVESPGSSPLFHLSALLPGGTELALVEGTGMFNQPSASPRMGDGDEESRAGLAYLQAISPLESANSAYRVSIMDLDGSNARMLFPAAGEPGLNGDDLQYPPVWSPDGALLAVIYQGNLWVIRIGDERASQLTGDGQATALDWSDQ